MEAFTAAALFQLICNVKIIPKLVLFNKLVEIIQVEV
jgi:hypothetical protein